MATRMRPTRSTPAGSPAWPNSPRPRPKWSRARPKGRGLGIAVHRSFLTYIATVVEVAVDEQGKLSIPHVDTAVDCGFPINPERIRSQMEGAAVMGTSLALYGEQFRQLSGRANGQRTARRAHPHRPARLRHAGERRRRAARTAIRTGALQRDLRGYRQANSCAAHQGSGSEGDLNPRRDPGRQPPLFGAVFPGFGVEPAFASCGQAAVTRHAVAC